MKKSKVKKNRANKPILHSTPLQGENPDPHEIDAVVALFAQRRYEEVEPLAKAMTKRFPLHCFGWKVLGAVFKQVGRSVDALIPMQRAVALSPSDAEAHNNLGDVLKDLGQLDAAVMSYRCSLAIKPDFAEAHNNLGIALRILGQLDAAVASYRRALEIKPDFAKAHYNLGNILKDFGQLNAAIASYRQALEIKPDYAKVHHNLGNVLKDLGLPDAAVASYRQALEINPDYAEVHSNLGTTLHDLGQLEGAMASYRRALEIEPDFAEAHNNLGVIQKDLGQLNAAMASHHRALEIKPDYAEAHSNLLFTHNYLSDQSATALLAEARRFGDLAARRAHPYTDRLNVPEPGRSLRVGLVSGDLRSHPVGYFIESVLVALSSNASSRLKLIAYSSYVGGDMLTERIKASCHGWHSAVGISDESLARQIRDDRIDILIDLSGHTAHNRLPMFAWKPAPVQVSWLGYFATTGIGAMDYLIADPWSLPKMEEVHFTEKIWHLPETRLCFTAPQVNVEVSPLPALTNGFITFGSFNSLTKVNDAVVALWARVLMAVPESRLFLKARQLGDASERRSVVSRFATHGISADWLMLEGPEAREKYLDAYHRVDIALDPFPFPGGTTSVEGLWMGVPVLTLIGESLLARQGVGILMNAGLPEWLSINADDYVARAAAHAGDLSQLALLRSGLRRKVLASPLFDASRFARHFEAALTGMWAQWCNQPQRK